MKRDVCSVDILSAEAVKMTIIQARAGSHHLTKHANCLFKICCFFLLHLAVESDCSFRGVAIDPRSPSFLRTMTRAADPHFSAPLIFEPMLMERIWGGGRLQSLYGKPVPAGTRIGESWELVDRPEAQSVVREGVSRGRTLHELWREEREAVFGRAPNAPRFPLLIKLLDAQEKLSLQVHPPAEIAGELGGEAKSEFWYVVEAEPGAELYVGLTKHSTREEIEEALETGTVEDHVHRISVRGGDAMFLPSGRVHAIGAGIVLVEIQENSDTTYRVFDWNRAGVDGSPRKLHIEESLRSIDFGDVKPSLAKQRGESLLRHRLFDVDKWQLTTAREVGPEGNFAVVACLTGELKCAEVRLCPGEFFLVPARLQQRELEPCADDTSLLRITVRS